MQGIMYENIIGFRSLLCIEASSINNTFEYLKGNGMAMFLAIYFIVMWNHLTKEISPILSVIVNYFS